MVLACLLLIQTPTWPAVKTLVVESWYRQDPAKSAVLNFTNKFPAKAKTFTQEFLMFPARASRVTVGKAALSFDTGVLGLDIGRSIPNPEAIVGAPLELAIVRTGKDARIYANGKLFTSLTLAPGPLTIKVDGPPGQILGQALYPRGLTVPEIVNNAKAGIALAGSLPDSKSIVLALKLGAHTEVPDPARIKPYRNALIAQEYEVAGVVEGHVKGLKPGSKVRVFRYGVLDGKKTDVEKQTTGSLATLNLQLLSADPALSREYQLDDLDTDLSGIAYVEIPFPITKKSK